MKKSAFQDVKITRYMSFDKFVSFLKDGLFMSSSLKFDDRWEGLLVLKTINTADWEFWAEFYRDVAPWVYISCWHREQHENMGMWKVYGKYSNAIAVQTSSHKLRDSFKCSGLGSLTYLDFVRYKNPLISEKLQVPSGLNVVQRIPVADWGPFAKFPVLQSFFLKHIAYEYEKEIRLVALDSEYVENTPNSKPGVTVDYRQIPEFIESIRVAPNAGSWFKLLVQDVLKRYDVEVEVLGSDLEAPDIQL